MTYEPTKIRARAPLRLGFAGGGTDVSPFSDQFGGMVLNATISLYAHCYAESRDDGKVVIEGLDVGQRFEGRPGPFLETDHPLGLICQVYNRIVRDFCRSMPFGVTLRTHADVPPGSGLGSSSTLVVAIITALAEMRRIPLGEYDIAHLAFEVERIDMSLAGGKQDQYAATFGGFNLMEFYADDRVIINPLRLRSGVVAELESSLVLYFTGRSRASAAIIDEQVRNVTSGNDQSIAAMKELKEQARRMKEALLLSDFTQFGEELRKGWGAKRQIAQEISTSAIEQALDLAIRNGAVGGKVSGAGGGGFMMIITPPDRKPAVVRAMSALDGQVMHCTFTQEGARAWRVR